MTPTSALPLALSALLLSAVLAPPALAAGDTEGSSQLTYGRDVAPILAERCVSLPSPGRHRADGAAHLRRSAAVGEVDPQGGRDRESCRRGMPTPHGAWENDRRLTDAERDTLLRWIKQGAPAGRRAAASAVPARRRRRRGALASGRPRPRGEVRAGRPARRRPRPVPRPGAEHAPDRGPLGPRGRDRRRATAASCTTSSSTCSRKARRRPTVGSAPGRRAWTRWCSRPAPAACSRRAAGWSPTCTTTPPTRRRATRPRSESTSSTGSPTRSWSTSGCRTTTSRSRPAPTDHEVRSTYTFRQDSVVHALLPHMHYRGKDFTYTAIYPDGRSEVLLKVPAYDFNWQTLYQLGEAARDAGGDADRVRRALRQLDPEPRQPRSHQGRDLRQRVVRRDDDRLRRLHGEGRSAADVGRGAAGQDPRGARPRAPRRDLQGAGVGGA